MSAGASPGDWSYKIQFWKTEVYKGKRKTTYYVRWKVDGRPFKEAFDTSALAESFRSDLTSAARRGEPFCTGTGRPASMLRKAATPVSWYEFACAYVDMKWPDVAPNSRVGIAESLATITPVLLTKQIGAPDPELLRKALYSWSFNTNKRLRGAVSTPAEPPQNLIKAVRWLEKNTVAVTALEDATVVRAVLDALSKKLDGSKAAAKTIYRKRAVLHNALEYGVELGYFDNNPLKKVKKRAPKSTESIDPAALPDRRRATALLAAVRKQSRSGPRLVAYFACIYYAAMRPSEVADLRVTDYFPPARAGDWGEFRLRKSAPSVAAGWTDSGAGRRQSRQLKHRAENDFRTVPCHPHLAELIAEHIEQFGTGTDGRLFRGARGGPVPDSMVSLTWRQARKAGLSEADYDAGIAQRPYDLRHACVTGWLNAGVDPAQVAAWAGHSVTVLLRVYVGCIVGRDQIARKRIEAAFRDEDQERDNEQETAKPEREHGEDSD
ncbi:tyrosine-type recombinase/integrase [Actinocrinis puniceicyclus]|uniref:Tyrosine-type recombinase/integrase n=1 Tax=Actinocrinis puniceicyclus TaxID=977794 RepID=A0A8J7WP83_9ACTN|nr:tyrosine-type recombinase/integrase [Actinocrinis puniceicyclus]MBS2966013.1 tyrosine-type recombinase/integrase [Actinocrinis puniceicyclus]